MKLRGELKTKAIVISICCMIFITGCESFVRKFTRKPKTEASRQEMVLVPEEYKGPQMSKEELYRQYFLFWKSWHDELINALTYSSSHKKKIDCLDQAVKNLLSMKQLIKEEKQKKLDGYIAQLTDLRDSIDKDSYGNNLTSERIRAERIKMNINRDFAYHHIKDYLI